MKLIERVKKYIAERNERYKANVAKECKLKAEWRYNIVEDDNSTGYLTFEGHRISCNTNDLYDLVNNLFWLREKYREELMKEHFGDGVKS